MQTQVYYRIPICKVTLFFWFQINKKSCIISNEENSLLPIINLSIPTEHVQHRALSKPKLSKNKLLDSQSLMGLDTSLVNESSCESCSSATLTEAKVTSPSPLSTFVPQFIKDKYGKTGIKISSPVPVATKPSTFSKFRDSVEKGAKIKEQDRNCLKKSCIERFLERKIRQLEERRLRGCEEAKSFDQREVRKEEIAREEREMKSFETRSKVLKKNKIKIKKIKFDKEISKAELSRIHDIHFIKAPAILKSPICSNTRDLSKSSPLGLQCVVSGIEGLCFNKSIIKPQNILNILV